MLVLSGRVRSITIKSLDRGYTWEAVELGDEEDGVFGNSDEDLAIAPDGGVHLVVCDVDQNGGKGIAVASLRVGEERWKWTAISRNRGNDRPWIEASPDSPEADVDETSR